MSKHPGGRPSFKPTPEQRSSVQLMAGHGWEQDKIAKLLKIQAKTLRKHFREELDNGAVNVEAALVAAQFKRATSSDSPATAQKATEFILHTRFGYRKTDSVELTGADGGPIETMEITDEMRAKALANFIARTKK